MEEGLGFLRNAVVNPHLLRLNRQFELVDVIAEHPHLLGIGIDNNATIVVTGKRLEVIGSYGPYTMQSAA